ncbi:MAG: hypothetical protein J6N81_00005 [Treponema sp.]|nr:hypothetical protein [Treponema sp.]
MKKIVSAAIVASVMAGSLFAADASIKLNARSHYTPYEKSFVKDNSTTANDTQKISQFAKSNDAMDIEIKNDYAGAHIGLALNGGTGTVAVDTKYYGWMNFGNAKVTAGVFESVFTKRQNKTINEEGLTDDGNIKNYGLSKILAITTGAGAIRASGASFMVDANNIGANCGDRVWSGIFDYTFADVAGGKLLLKAAVVDSVTDAGASGRNEVTNAYRTDTTDDTRTTVGTGFAFDAALQREDFSVEGMVRTSGYYNVATGVYFTASKLIPDTTAVLGFTYGSQSKKNDGTTLAGTTVATAGWNAYAIDWRFVNNSIDKVTLVLNGKYESLTAKTDDAKAETGLYVVGEIGYALSDLIDLGFDAGIYMCDLDDEDKSDKGENYFQIRPSVGIKAGKGAKITAALNYKQLLNTGDIADTSTTAIRTISVPVVFRVKM